MSLLTLLNVDPVELTGYARAAVAADPHYLEQILPTRQVEDLDFEMSRGATTRGNVASFRAFNTPAKIGKRQPISKVRGSLPPISEKIGLGEEELLRLERLIRGGGGNDPALTQAIYDDAATRALAVADRMELARGELIDKGTITLAEGGIVSVVIDSGRTGGHTVTASNLWSDHTNGDPIGDLITWTNTYRATNGEDPGAWIANRTVISHMLRCAKVTTAAVNVLGVQPLVLTRNQLNDVLNAHGIAPIVSHDDQFKVAGSDTPPIRATRIVAVPQAASIAKLGSSFWTTTAEALVLASSGRVRLQEAPGITVTVDETTDPVNVWTKASGIGLPFLANPNLTLSAGVL